MVPLGENGAVTDTPPYGPPGPAALVHDDHTGRTVDRSRPLDAGYATIAGAFEPAVREGLAGTR